MRIFYDVDTQNDFMNSTGALYVPNAETIQPNLRLLTKYVQENNIQVAGSVDNHFGTEEYKEREGELIRWGGPFPDHCMNKTRGQSKIIATYYPEQKFHPHYLDNHLDEELLENVLGSTLFFEKQSYDVFTNPAMETFLELIKVQEAVVYGVATDYCIKAVVLGMQKRNIQTYVVEDAIMAVNVNPPDGKKAIEEMVQAGAKLVTTKDVLEGRV